VSLTAAPLSLSAELSAAFSTAFSTATQTRFEREVAKYPSDQKASAVMACLAIVQQEQGFVSAQSEKALAQYLGMPPIAVHEVTTFYNMYNTAPVGRFKLNVCTNLPCRLRRGESALKHLCETLKVEEGATTADGLFTIQKSECLGACADAPVMLLNDRQMLSFMTEPRLDDLLSTMRAHAQEAQAEADAPSVFLTEVKELHPPTGEVNPSPVTQAGQL
jgi:NADH-quinone oxidoreductase subunit E